MRRRQAVAEDGDHSLDRTPPLLSSTPLPGASGSKDWRKNFASNKSFASSFQSASDQSKNGDWSLGGDSGYGGLDSSRLAQYSARLETSALVFTGLVEGCLSLRSLRPGGAQC